MYRRRNIGECALGAYSGDIGNKSTPSGGSSGNFSQKCFSIHLLPSCINLCIATYMFSASASWTAL